MVIKTHLQMNDLKDEIWIWQIFTILQGRVDDIRNITPLTSITTTNLSTIAD